jgi:hypothetical protein
MEKGKLQENVVVSLAKLSGNGARGDDGSNITAKQASDDDWQDMEAHYQHQENCQVGGGTDKLLV